MYSGLTEIYTLFGRKETFHTGPDGSVAMSSTNGLVGTGFAFQSGFFKGPMGRCKVTTPSSL